MKIICFLAFLSIVNHSFAFYDRSDVVELTPATFKTRVLDSNEVWIVEFYAEWCGHCKALAPEYSKAATALKGIVRVGAVNADEHKQLAQQYGVRGFPTIKLFGLSKTSPTDYNGQRTASGLVDAGLQEAKKVANQRLTGKSSGGGSKSGSGSDVVELTDSNFNKQVLDSKDVWLVEFYAPWCGHCQKLKPIWESVATELKDKVKVGALDATVHQSQANKYEIKGFPTIKVFINGEVEDYMGGRSKEDLVQFALAKLDDNAPVPELVQITNEKDLTDNCESKQLCIISVLPHILDCDAKCRNDYLDILKKIAEKFKKNQWAYLWSEAVQQPELEESLGLGGFGYPAMAALNIRKMKYTWLKGSFGFDGINEFLRDLSYGRGSSVPVKGAKIPKIQKVDAWDGKDGVVPQMDDDIISDEL